MSTEYDLVRKELREAAVRWFCRRMDDSMLRVYADNGIHAYQMMLERNAVLNRCKDKSCPLVDEVKSSTLDNTRQRMEDEKTFCAGVEDTLLSNYVSANGDGLNLVLIHSLALARAMKEEVWPNN